MKVAAVRTAVDPSALKPALGREWRTLWQVSPPPNAVAVLLGQIGIETGWRDCWCWNLGNVKASSSSPADYCELSGVWEVIDGHRVELPLGAPGTQFRAFASLGEGARFYLRELRGRFAAAWPAVLSGDPFAFVVALQRARYFTAPLGTYLRGVVREYDPFADPGLRTRDELVAALDRLDVNAGELAVRVRAFQAAHLERCLTVDGDPGPLTRAALRHELVALT